MRRILSTAGIEFRIALRNRWVAIATGLMVLFALVLAAAGAAPTGDVGVDRLSVTVVSLTSLAVYLVPLLALLMSFDAVAGEVERGTLPLLLTYPVSRARVLAGKLLAHVVILGIAVTLGYGAAALAAFATDPEATRGLPALIRLIWTSVLLGATFLGLGYLLSSLSRRPSGAAGLAIGLWLALVVLYDLGLLALVVSGTAFATEALPALLLANPADAFRLFNLAAANSVGAAGGMGGAAASIPLLQSVLSLALWPFAALLLAVAAFRKVTP
ncbi:Cu-processing system permease protein [Gemmobacter megaterium]|uniref:Cu-processing system permease protein n=1 Tax=Gemmobacter megaterium TaxID=1086013 RepID=A0A1N7QRU6_9RHOB|nr:ABC transporter permease subunit [Gemmobacter megaterium]GGE29165.1 NosY permease [Gemmobacter megaterium]SIT25612.1 Cu-processing system permease protein [Gemmobacter megaterium]